MKRQIRSNVFETNSSSTHSLCICTEEEFKEWKNGTMLFDTYEEEFIKKPTLSNSEKEDAIERYNLSKKQYFKDWDSLTELEKEEWYNRYAEDMGIIDDDAESYDEYMKRGYLESYEEHYTTKSGDKIVAFGRYGMD